MKFNKDYANKVSKAEFIENHKHVKDAGKEWEKLQVKPKPVKADEK